MNPRSARFKPDPAGFRYTAEMLGVEPGEAVYVGDRPEVDLAGARAAGMPAVLVDRTGKVDLPEDAPVISDLRALLG